MLFAGSNGSTRVARPMPPIDAERSAEVRTATFALG